MLIKVLVKPNSKEESVEKLSDDEYIVKLKEPDEKGKANVTLLKILRNHFKGTPRIIKGFSNRNKIIEIY